jgi:uncharacterized repeat protein (TIGR03847 family)
VTESFFSAPHHVTVGYTGVPGERTFLVQVEDDQARLTLLVEKGQVAGVGDLLAQVLAQIGDAPATDWDREAMGLREPIEPAWRVGEIGLGIDPETERVVIELTAVTAEETVEPDVVRISIDRDQARRLAAHTQEIVGQGRPECQLCGRPMGSDGSHVCPATNGHGALSR